MATPFQQAGKGTYIFGDAATPTLVYDDDLINVTINTSRSTVTRPATYGKPVVEQFASDVSRTLTLEYLGDPTTAASFWNTLKTGIDSDDGGLYFDIKFQDGPTSVTNPRYTGRAMVTELQIGSAVNTIWQASVSYPIVDYTESIS